MRAAPHRAAAAVLLALVAGGPLMAQTSGSEDGAGAHDHPQQAAPPPSPSDHGEHQETPPAPAHGGHDSRVPATPDLPPFIPRLTDADRRNAFPDVEGHATHDRGMHSFVLVDRFEWRHAGGADDVTLDTSGWIGGDRNRIWFRTEGEGSPDRLDHGDAHVLFGRQVLRWWDLVVGVRQDVRPGAPQTWAAIGLQGLAPHWFEVEVTAYVGAAGRTEARVAVEYDLLLTNRLVLQPALEADLAGRADRERLLGRGLRSTEAGLRLRYELRREFAPYIGVSWNRRWGGTADFAAGAGHGTKDVGVVTGLRVWF